MQVDDDVDDLQIQHGEIPPEVLDLMKLLTPSDNPTDLDLNQRQVIAYMAGYIVRKIRIKFKKCTDCLLTVSLHDASACELYRFIEKKQYNCDQSSGLALPSQSLINTIEALEVCFRKSIIAVISSDGVMSALFAKGMDSVKDHSNVFCSTCFKSLRYAVKLFMRVRIHHFLREENRRILHPNKVRNRKFLQIAHC